MSPACHPPNAHRCWRPRPDADARVHFLRLNLLHPHCPLPPFQSLSPSFSNSITAAAYVPVPAQHHVKRHGHQSHGLALAAIFLPPSLPPGQNLKTTTATATQTACHKHGEMAVCACLPDHHHLSPSHLVAFPRPRRPHPTPLPLPLICITFASVQLEVRPCRRCLWYLSRFYS